MIKQIKSAWTGGSFIQFILGTFGLATFIAAITFFILIIEVLR